MTGVGRRKEGRKEEEKGRGREKRQDVGERWIAGRKGERLKEKGNDNKREREEARRRERVRSWEEGRQT